MPVLLDSASQNIAEISASDATSGSVNQNHTINPLAQAVTVTLFVFLAANVDTTDATLTATFGGQEMTMQGDPVRWGSNKNLLAVFTLAAPPTGQQEWEASVSGLTANSSGFWLMGACESNSGVLAVGNPVTVSGDTAGATTENTVTVDSVAPAYKVITAHAITSPNLFSGYNLTTRAAIDGTYAYIAYLLSFFGFNFFPYVADAQGGELLIGDAPGAATVTGTVTQPSTAAWGAIGLPLIPAPVVLAASLSVSTSISAALSLQRVASPSPLRTWVIGQSQ
ncbi:hypothetical protein [Mycobacterium malmoense]|uniref:hypothetical protein n=1 Tax=Mycobacterium malmoense TaxID=1780 RepID=UPI0008F7F172|nr:hypothetical protein [Mycobacterium malmoense]OIN79774.1 hypothetical protein BMG05_16645 [Mycobacterium malmoense]